MNKRLTEYIESGKQLDDVEREVAALELQRVSDSDRAEIDAAWKNEISRRVEEIVDGSAQLIDGPESLANIKAELAARRA